MANKELIYAVENNVTVDEFRSLLVDSGLGARRPVDDATRLELMLRNANLTVTARADGVLVGIARSVTDFFLLLLIRLGRKQAGSATKHWCSINR